YLAIDKFSMLAKTFLACLAKHITIGKMLPGTNSLSDPFGDMNIAEALFYPPQRSDMKGMTIGRELYESFLTVVILHRQMRVTDEVWHDFLTHLREGRVTEDHITMLRMLVVTDEDYIVTNFNEYPWTEMSLITPQHGVCLEWNAVAVRKHCQKVQEMLFVWRAEDKIKDRDLTIIERLEYAVTMCKGKKNIGDDLPWELEMTIGTKVTIIKNLNINAGIVNGSQGTVVKNFLDPDEGDYDESQEMVKLTHPPVCILIQLERTSAPRLEGLEENIVPIQPSQQIFKIHVKKGKNMTAKTVKRRQYPMTLAYAFTDYCSKGKTRNR
ncbi:hypothetical protein FISHEDRAFT_42281, partial [Fistulina hepatica ATCC 64428]